MKELTLDEIKQVQINILIEIDKVCRQNNINYSLNAGTLLGAVRHKGFIPWDDDIDIFMTGSDYDKFLDYCKKNNTAFELINNDTDKNNSLLFSRCCDRNTICKGNDRIGINGGVAVDVLSVENIGNNPSYILNKKYILKLIHWLLSSKRSSFSDLKTKNKFFYFIKILSVLFTTRSLVNFYWKLCGKYRFIDSKYVCFLRFSDFYRLIYEKKYFEEYTEIEFEGHNFMTIKHWDVFLTKLYGNYMELPPVEKRKRTHDFIAYWK